MNQVISSGQSFPPKRVRAPEVRVAEDLGLFVGTVRAFDGLKLLSATEVYQKDFLVFIKHDVIKLNILVYIASRMKIF